MCLTEKGLMKNFPYVIRTKPVSVEASLDSLLSVGSCYLSTFPFIYLWYKSWWGGVAQVGMATGEMRMER